MLAGLCLPYIISSAARPVQWCTGSHVGCMGLVHPVHMGSERCLPCCSVAGAALHRSPAQTLVGCEGCLSCCRFTRPSCAQESPEQCRLGWGSLRQGPEGLLCGLCN